jgi:hypothetical protein
MIPAGFGLAIGDSSVVGHAVGHNCTLCRTRFRVSAARRGASLGLFDEQGDRVVAPGSTGRRLLVEDDDGACGGTPILSRRMVWRRASAARRPLTGRACTDGRPGGGGSAKPRSGRSRDGRPRPGLRPLSHAVAVVRTRPDGALACRPEQATRGRRRRRAQSRGSGSSELQCDRSHLNLGGSPRPLATAGPAGNHHRVQTGRFS